MNLLHLPFWLYAILVVAYWVAIAACVISVLRENRNPVNTTIWVLALLLVPVFGMLFYLFFGRSMRLVMISRKRKRKLLKAHTPPKLGTNTPFDNPDLHAISRLAGNLNGTHVFEQNQITVYDNGNDKFQQLKTDLLNARKSINIEYYIFSDDKLGHEVSDILCQKAREGVKVRVLYDHVGSFTVKTRFFTKMRHAGVETHPFFRVSFPTFANRVNWRNHRKIIVIDGTIGYIGGMNIASRYIEGMGKGKVWRDTHLRITGAAVAALYYIFAIDWNFTGNYLIPTIDQEVSDAKVHDADDAIHGSLQLVTSGPGDEYGNIASIYFKAITGARKRVYIETPYFLPPEPLLKALETAAQSGVDVRIIIPRHSDSHLLNFATYSYVTQCLRAGIKIYMYEKGMMHSKNMIVDDELVTTGSANFDFRSFECNFEANVIIYGKEINREFRDMFFRNLADSTKIRLSKWRKRPAPQRALESLVRMMAPIL